MGKIRKNVSLLLLMIGFILGGSISIVVGIAAWEHDPMGEFYAENMARVKGVT